MPVLDNELATKDELVALKELTFRQAVIPVESILSSDNRDDGTSAKNIDDSSEISVNMPDSGGGIRRIVRNASTNRAHLRFAGSALLDDKSSGRSKQLHDDTGRDSSKGSRKTDVGTNFNMKELIMTVHPEIGINNATCSDEIDMDPGSGVQRAISTSSLRSKGKDVITDDCSTRAPFPFSLPSSLLDEADDDVWNPSTLLDLIAPSETIVWETFPSDMEGTNKFSQDDEVNEPDDLEPDSQQANENDDEISLSFDGTQLPSTSTGQGYNNDDVSDASDQSQAEEGATNTKTRKSMFDGIWEQTYRENVTWKNEDVLELTKTTEITTPKIFDFTAAEDNCQYDGPSDYGPLFVSSDLDLYFDSFIFHTNSSEDDSHEKPQIETTAPRIQLFKFDRDLLNREKQHGAMLHMAADLRERYIGVWKLDVMAMGPYAQARLAPIKIPKRGFHGDIVTSGGKDVVISESRKFILCLSDSALYFIIDDDISTQQPAGTKRTFPSRIPQHSVSCLI